jgi:hypothetical protein
MGCGGAFTTAGQDNDAGVGVGGSTSAGGQSGTTAGAGGDVSQGGSDGTGGARAGAGGTDGTGGSGGSSTGGAGGSDGGRGGGGGSVDAGPDYRACNGPGQCLAVETSCCGVCGTPELSAFTAVNTMLVKAYDLAMCPGTINCPACLMGTNPNIGARCVQGHCQPFDVRNVVDYTSCQQDTDCVLRAGLGCCTCGGPTAGWVAVSAAGAKAIEQAECTPDSGCAACVPTPPTNLRAACSSHSCKVVATP